MSGHGGDGGIEHRAELVHRGGVVQECSHVGGDGLQFVSRAANPEAQRVVRMLVLVRAPAVADFEPHLLEPPCRGRVDAVLVVAQDEEIVVACFGGVLEDHDRPAVIVEAIDRPLHERWVDGEPVDGATGHGAGEHRAADNHDGIALLDAFDGIGALGQAPAGADDDGDPRVAGVKDGLTVPVGYLLAIVQERAVKVDGDEVVAWHGMRVGAARMVRRGRP